MKLIDKFLNGITMYKLVLDGLFTLAFVSVVFGFLGILPYSGLSLLSSIIVLTLVCYLSNYIIAKLFGVQTNVESASISSLILFFVLFPLSSISDVWMFIVVGILAMVSKYALVIRKKHIFNPVAIAVFIIGLFGSGVASWWVGSSVMIFPVVILGFLILRKVFRFELFVSFLVMSLVSIFIFGLGHGTSLYSVFNQFFLSGPILFFGAVMLTEPLTTPPSKKFQIVYGGLVGILFGAQFQIGPLYNTPEFALIMGNIFSYVISPRTRSVLTLVQKNKLSADIYDFVWKTDKELQFKAGQYLEWTLGHSHPDSRGNRRFFTIASSPTEKELYLGVKFYSEPSSFKKKLLSLGLGDKIVASQLAGEFTIPEDKNRRLVFIAGGIGITPFRSMIKYLSDAGEKRDVTLFFSNRTPNDIVYKDIFDEAKDKIGVKTFYIVNDLAGAVVTPDTRVGLIDTDLIMKEVSDYKDCYYYISGPHSMVSAFEDTLSKLGIKRSQIKTDFFPGYA